MTEIVEPPFVQALRAVSRAFTSAGLPAVFIGGVAVIAHGVARYTADIDATVLAARTSPESLMEALRKFGIEERLSDAVAFARTRQVLLVRHRATGVPVDVTLAWLPFEEEAIGSGVDVDYAGVPIRVLRPEDLVIYKLIARRPRDIQDAESLLALHKTGIDLGRVRKVIEEFCATLEDNQSLVIFDRLVGAAVLHSPPKE